MALEDLTGPAKFIDALVTGNPVSNDDRREGDDHIRGIKNVLRNTFPNVNGAVTLSDDDLNGIPAALFAALQKGQNLADVPNKPAAIANLGALAAAQNLVDLANARTARVNIGMMNANGQWLVALPTAGTYAMRVTAGPGMAAYYAENGQHMLEWDVPGGGKFKLWDAGGAADIRFESVSGRRFDFAVNGAPNRLTIDSTGPQVPLAADGSNTAYAASANFVQRNTLGGVGRVWTAFTTPAQRALATDYTAPSYPINVAVILRIPATAGAYVALIVGTPPVGTSQYFNDSGAGTVTCTLTGIVPAGQKYQVISSGGAPTVLGWAELR